jgi:hypothetical protein
MLTFMVALKELDSVRVVRLLQVERPYNGTAVMRPPRVGDTGAIVHVYAANGEAACYIVECVDAEGYTLWLADFLPDEIEADL